MLKSRADRTRNTLRYEDGTLSEDVNELDLTDIASKITAFQLAQTFLHF